MAPPRPPLPVARMLTRGLQRSTQREWLPARVQRSLVETAARLVRVPRGTGVARVELGGVPAERVAARGVGSNRAVLYLHGGGYVVGSPRTHRSLAAQISKAANAPVYVADYRLAPEHPHPAGVEDALAAYRGLLETGLEPERIVIAGDSSGAGLALAVAMRLRDAGEPLPAGLALINGWLDLGCSAPSFTLNEKRDVGLRLPWLRWCAKSLLGGADPAPEMTPLEADLSGLPPTYVQVGTYDLLLSDSDRFVERATAAGMDVSYDRFDGMWHDFQFGADLIEDAERAVTAIGRALRGFWGDEVTADGAGPGSSNGRRTPTVAIVGAGFGGVGMGITLKRAGIDSFTILEKGERVGGVWRDNTYPGAACDIPSHLYSFSFEPRADWSRRYSPQPEILDYLEGCVERYGIGPHLRLGTEVTGARFDEASGRWRVETSDGTIEADVLVSSTGQLNRPATRGIPGLDRFEGPLFHSSQWDHDVELTGKRVAVIGTGASTIQIVPAIADRVGRLDLYQRSAPYVIPKKDRAYMPWERRLFRVPGIRHITRFRQWLAFEVFALAFIKVKPLGRLGARMFERQLADQVADPELRGRLVPDSVMGCKRVLISSEYFPALARDNVEVIGGGVRELTETGVVAADGTEREADAVVLSTGFASTDFLAPMEIHGLGGRELNEEWRNGAEAYLGISVAGFPNLFIMYGPNTNLGAGSILYQLESQMAYILDAVRTLQREEAAHLTVRPDVQAEFSREIQDRLRDSVWMTGCSNWYVDEHGRNTNNWPGFTLEYRRRTRRLDPADYELQLSTRAE